MLQNCNSTITGEKVGTKNSAMYSSRVPRSQCQLGRTTQTVSNRLFVLHDSIGVSKPNICDSPVTLNANTVPVTTAYLEGRLLVAKYS